MADPTNFNHDNAITLYNALKAKNIGGNVAQALVINAIYESNCDPSAGEVGGTGLGLWQWSFGQASNISGLVGNLNGQIDYLIKNDPDQWLNIGQYSPWNDFANFLKSDKPVAELDRYFCYCWERPAPSPKALRIGNAQRDSDLVKAVLGEPTTGTGEQPSTGGGDDNSNNYSGNASKQSSGRRFYQIDDQTYKNGQQVFRKIRDNVWVLTTLNSDGATSIYPSSNDNSGSGSGNTGGGGTTPSGNTGGGGTTPSGSNTDKIIQWFEDHKGKLTYSMTGSRIGTDGTADCSGSMAEAMKEAGYNVPNPQAYSTENFHTLLLDNGFKLISEDKEWSAQRGDIVIFGRKGYSAGADGHIMIMTSPDKDISTCYATYGAPGTAVAELNFDTQWKYSGCPYFYAYRAQ